MTTHVFTIVINQRPTEADLRKLDDKGLDDATFGVDRGLPVVEFDREAPTLAEAVASAIRDLEAADLVASRVLDEDLLTLADIADRIGQSRESVRRYVTGDRGPGGFPPPANPARDGTVFYRWSEVAPWVRRNLQIDVPEADPALALANLLIQARRLAGQVAHSAALTDLLSI
ncbi:hypothetical protein [Dactylosporangium sp. NPDC048998]|uniref:hypothetical protein n=1 Tax=Dactylosporangium sp. NPDC048998 TaxID=3363976 RepID=UPI00371C4E5B